MKDISTSLISPISLLTSWLQARPNQPGYQLGYQFFQVSTSIISQTYELEMQVGRTVGEVGYPTLDTFTLDTFEDELDMTWSKDFGML